MGQPKSRRWLQGWAGLAATAMLIAGCGGGSEEPAAGNNNNGDNNTSSPSGEDTMAPTGGSFSVQLGEPSFLAPTSQCYESECSQVISTIFAGLLSVDPKTSEQVFGGVAESIESEDGKVWTVKLKDGWTFHNGEPVDAESYLRAWNYSAYGPNATQTGFFFSPVEGYDDLQGKKPKAKEMTGLRAVDDTTIEITLSQPFSQWPLVMSYTPAFAPIAKECLDDLKACQEQPIGNGPYQISGKWEHNTSITVERYEDYQGEDAGNADEIVFKIYGDVATAYKDWQAGNLDITGTDPTQVPQARAAAGDRIVEVDSGSFAYFGFPLFMEEFQDIRIRQALSLAIDRETIADKVYNGLVSPAGDVIAGFVPGARTDACEYCRYDPDEAKRLYEEAGGLPGDKITLWFNNDGGHEQFVQALANGWRNVLGLDYELESQPFTPYLATLGKGEFNGPFRLGWLPDYPSPENYLDPIYGEGSSNYGKWSGPAQKKFLELVAKGDAAATVEEGLPAYQAAADVVLEELPVIPLWFGTTFIVYSENVDNVNYDPLNQILLTEVSVNQ
jgi:oligopeptide transport system substrate-binding protein